jgi:hypothetical protein
MEKTYASYVAFCNKVGVNPLSFEQRLDLVDYLLNDHGLPIKFDQHGTRNE